jgi:bacterioferritin-associated ferredoxin
LVRLSGAYFEALMAQEQLTLVLAQMDAYAAQLQSAKRAFAVGVGTRTDIDDAQARYDMSVAQELEARQNIGYTRRQLQVIVNQPVESLAQLDAKRMELLPPVPANRSGATGTGEGQGGTLPDSRFVRAAQQERERYELHHQLPIPDNCGRCAIQYPDLVGGSCKFSDAPGRSQPGKGQAAVRSQTARDQPAGSQGIPECCGRCFKSEGAGAGRAFCRSSRILQPERLSGRNAHPDRYSQCSATADECPSGLGSVTLPVLAGAFSPAGIDELTERGRDDPDQQLAFGTGRPEGTGLAGIPHRLLRPLPEELLLAACLPHSNP